MVNIDIVKDEIIKRILPLAPEKVYLFGSYARGTATEESDIDLCIITSISKKDARNYTLQARKKIRDLIYKYRIGFDIITVSPEYIKEINSQFFNEEILLSGQLIYG